MFKTMKNEIDKFDESERKSRLYGEKIIKILVEKGIIDRYTFTNDKFCHYDCIGYKEERKCLIEIKLRNIFSHSYDTTFLEKEKLDNMKAEIADAYFYIVCFEKDNVGVIYRIDEINEDNTKSSIKLMPKYTQSNKKILVNKRVFLLPIVDKKKYIIK